MASASCGKSTGASAFCDSASTAWWSWISRRPIRPRVFFGAWVTLEDEDGAESSTASSARTSSTRTRRYISMDAPLGRALLRKAIDDEVRVEVPGGAKTYVVVAVSYAPRRDASAHSAEASENSLARTGSCSPAEFRSALAAALCMRSCSARAALAQPLLAIRRRRACAACRTGCRGSGRNPRTPRGRAADRGSRARS